MRTRLFEHALKGVIGQVGAKHVEGIFHVRIDEGFLQRGAKMHRGAGSATQRFGDRADETGVRLAGLDLKADKPRAPARLSWARVAFRWDLPDMRGTRIS